MRDTFGPGSLVRLVSTAINGAAGGSGDCGSAAMGAASSVAINLLIDSLKDQEDKATFDRQGNQTDADTAGDLQHSKNVTALIGLIATALDLDPNAASVAGQIETENNQIAPRSAAPLVTIRCQGTAAQCQQQKAVFWASLKGQLLLAAAGGDQDKAIACGRPGNSCPDLDARYVQLLSAFGINGEQLDEQTIRLRIQEINTAEGTLDRLFGEDEVRKQLAREFLADGKITAAGLATKLADLEQQEWNESTIGQLYNSIASLFSSGDEVEPDFETDTTPSGDPNDPKGKENAIVMATVLAIYAAAQGEDVDLGNPPPFMPDQVGYTSDDQPLFQDPQTEEYYVLDEQGKRQDVPTQSNVVQDYLAAKAQLEQSPATEKEIGVTEDGKTIYRDQSGNEYVKDAAGRQISLQEYESGATESLEYKFNEDGSGTNLRRTTKVDGQTIQINSGHAYNRSHTGGDVKDSGLSMDQIDSAIVNDITQNIDIKSIPRVPQRLDRTISIGDYSITYRVSLLPNGNITVSTYFPDN